MKFLIGNEKVFYNFIDSISASDKVAILTHTDLDGISSGIFIEEIIKSKELKVSLIEFLTYEKGMFEKLLAKLGNNLITKVFISDVNADSIDLEGFIKLREKFDVFFIDHHPASSKLKFKDKIIKTQDYDCSGLTIYSIGEKFLGKKWSFLACACAITDASYKNPENLEFIKSFYPVESEEKIMKSEIGKLSLELSYCLVYYKNNLRKAYSLIKERNFEEIRRIYLIVEEEFQRLINEFKENAEFYEKEKLYFYKINSKFSLASALSTHLSVKEPGKVFVFFSDVDSEKIKISARCQSKSVDLNILLQKSIENLANANAGGHPEASAALIQRQDWEKFKENLLENLNK